MDYSSFCIVVVGCIVFPHCCSEHLFPLDITVSSYQHGLHPTTDMNNAAL